jgi:hypothetical protein
MPNAGIEFECDIYEWRLSLTTTDDTSSTGLRNFVNKAVGTAVLQSDFAPNSLYTATGVSIQISYAADSGSDWSVELPALGIHLAGTGTDAAFRFTDLKVYATLYSQRRIVWGGFQILSGGVVLQGGGGGEITVSPLAPGYAYPFGSSCQLAAYSSPNASYDDPIDYDTAFKTPVYTVNHGVETPTGTYLYPPGLRYKAYSFLGSVTAKATGGYRWYKDGSWHDDPIELRAVGYSGGIDAKRTSDSSVTIGNTVQKYRVIDSPLVTRSDSYGNYQWAYASHEVVDTQTDGGNYLFLWPKQDHKLHKMDAGYASMVLRAGLPGADGASGTVHQDYSSPNDETDTSSATNVLPTRDLALGTIRDGTHPIEDALSDGNPCPYRANRGNSTGFGGVRADDCGVFTLILDPQGRSNFPNDGWPEYSPCAAVPTYDFGHSDSEASFYPSNVYLPSSTLSEMVHSDPLMALFQARSSPHASYFDWFPPNDQGGDDEDPPNSQNQWPVDGGAITNKAWINRRMQYLYQATLPPADRTRTLADLVASCLDESGHSLYQDSNAGPNLRWLGVSRWVTMECSPNSTAYEKCPSSLQLRPEWTSAVSSADADLSFDSDGIGISPKSDDQATVTLTLALASLGSPPYMFPQTCGSVDLDWTGFSEVDGSVTGFLGGSASAGSLASPGKLSLPRGIDPHYAGSWGQQNGGYDDDGESWTDDLGQDVAPGGESESVANDPSTCQAYQSVTGKQGTILRLTLTLGGGTRKLKYPIFNRAAGKPQIVTLTGAQQAILWPDGPGILFGNLTFTNDDGDFVAGGLVKGLGHKATLVDAIAYRRLFFQGVDVASGGQCGTIASPVTIAPLTDELYQRFDSYQGQSITVAAKFSTSFVLPSGTDSVVRFALVNTMAETPPLALLPSRGRDLNWLPMGDGSSARWDLAKEPRDVISPVTPLKVYDPSDNLISSSTPSPSGWAIQRYSPAVQNDELAVWKLKQDGKTFAQVRPFHGWFWIGKEPQGSVLALLSRSDGRLHRIVDKDGNLWYGATDVPGRNDWTNHDLDASATDAGLSRGTGSRTLAVIVSSGSATVRVEGSEDQQAPITTMDYGPATSADICSVGDGKFVVARIDGGTVRLTVGQTKDAAIVAGPFDTNVSGLSGDARVRLDNSADPGNKPTLIVLVADAGDTTAYKTTDYRTLTP